MLLWDGFEGESNWSINTEGETAFSSEHKTEGKSSLQVNVGGKIPAHGLILKKPDAGLDVSFANKIVLDIYNSGSPCQLALAFYTDGFRESVPKPINNGLNRDVTFEISPKDFKTAFGYTSVADTVMLIVYPGDNSEGAIYFDNMRIKKYSGLEYEPPGISPALEVTTEEELPVEIPPTASEGAYSILNGSSPGDSPVVPEHKTAVLLGAGLIGFAFFRKKV